MLPVHAGLAELVRSRTVRAHALIIGKGVRRRPFHQKGREGYLVGIFEGLVRDQKRQVL